MKKKKTPSFPHFQLGKGWWSHCGESTIFISCILRIFLRGWHTILLGMYQLDLLIRLVAFSNREKTAFISCWTENFLLFCLHLIRHSIELEGKSAAGNWYRLFLLGSKRAYHCIRESWFFKKLRERGGLSSGLNNIIVVVIISGPLAAFPATFPIVFVSFWLVYICMPSHGRIVKFIYTAI